MEIWKETKLKMKKHMKEFTMDCCWGKIAMVAWGDPSKPPVLLVHGYMDSAATFFFIIDHLPDDYYYVAVDMPGHGKSDPFPAGGLASHLDLVSVTHAVVEHLKWERFVYLAHSRGSIMGFFYNYFYPGIITKMILIDPAPSLSMYYYPPNKPSHWFLDFYEAYYKDYDTWNNRSTKEFTYDEAVNLLYRNRSLTKDQAEILISRSLIPVAGGKFRLSWQSKMKKLVTVPMSEETLCMVITEKASPILVIEAAEKMNARVPRDFSENILEKCRQMLPDFSTVTVASDHDMHITSPEIVAQHIDAFLKSKTGFKAKL